MFCTWYICCQVLVLYMVHIGTCIQKRNAKKTLKFSIKTVKRKQNILCHSIFIYHRTAASRCHGRSSLAAGGTARSRWWLWSRPWPRASGSPAPAPPHRSHSRPHTAGPAGGTLGAAGSTYWRPGSTYRSWGHQHQTL